MKMIKKLGLAIILLMFSCVIISGKKKRLPDDIKCFQISRDFPVVDNDGKLHGYYQELAHVYTSADQRLYRMRYFYWVFIGHDGEIETREHALVFKTGDSLGYYFNVDKKIAGLKVNVDSMLKKQWFSKWILKDLLPTILLNKISESTNRTGDTLKIGYAFQEKKDTSHIGMLYLNYTSNLKFSDLTLADQFDNKEGLKLYQAKIVNAPRYMKDYKISVDEIIQNSELKQIPVTDSMRNEALIYFEKTNSFK